MTEPLELVFTVPGDPVPKGRPRVGQGRAYTPAKTEHAEQAVGLLARASLRSRTPIEVSHGVAVGIDFFVKTRRRCDIDNLVKLVLDALNGIAWVDDDQVVSLAATKQHAPTEPRTVVRVRAVPP